MNQIARAVAAGEPKALKLDTWYELKRRPGVASYGQLVLIMSKDYLVSEVYKNQWVSLPVFKKPDGRAGITLCLIFSLEGIVNGCTKVFELENAQSVHFEKAIKENAFKVTLEKGDLKIQWKRK